MSAPRELAPGAYAVRLPLPWGGLDHVHVFLFRRLDGWLLLDCGLNTPDSVAALGEALLSLRIEWRSLRRIVVSHLHPDHLGAAAEIRRRSGAPVAMHPREASVVKPLAPGADSFGPARAFLARQGVPQADLDALAEESRKGAALSERLRVDEPILPGHSLDWIGGRLVAVALPGHAPALLGFHDADRKQLYGTDALLQLISPNIGLYHFSEADPLSDYFATLARIEALEVETVIPSHGEPFQDVDGVVRSSRKHHRRRLERIADVVREGPLTGWAVAGQVWGVDRPLGQRRFALAEALAHLEFLRRTGQVEANEIDGGVRWQAI